MRELKFRQILADGRHFYWGFVDGKYVGPVLNMADGNYYPSDQFTGLLDKTGAEIYEGDRVESDDDSGEVRWSDLDAAFYAVTNDYGGVWLNSAQWTIIGNIYEEGK